MNKFGLSYQDSPLLHSPTLHRSPRGLCFRPRFIHYHNCWIRNNPDCVILPKTSWVNNKVPKLIYHILCHCLLTQQTAEAQTVCQSD